MPLPVVTIVGRPNVGKSSLLNLLAGERISIVDPRAGITRDRVSTIVQHDERYFELVDTGGIGIVDMDQLEQHVEEQIRYAIDRAQLVLFVVDVRDGITPLDTTVAELLRRTAQPVLLVANKVDTDLLRNDAGVFQRLGYGEPVCISAHLGFGRTDLLERIVATLGEHAGEAPETPFMKLAIVGKRNAGKSTLVNALAGEERMIVSEIPGTTRDAVDVTFEKDGRKFIAIDTAGVRKKRSMSELDYYSYTRALRSIQRADVVLFLIDATVPIGEVDLRLARAVLDEHKPVVFGINKWDLAKNRATADDFSEYLTKLMPWLDYAPLTLLTAKTGKNVDAVVDVALALHKQAHTRVGTGKLNAALEAVVGERGPSPKRGTKRVRIYYATQISTAPPTIVFFCNDAELIRDEYQRYMERRLRDILPFREVPMRLIFRTRGQSKAPRGDATEIAPQPAESPPQGRA